MLGPGIISGSSTVLGTFISSDTRPCHGAMGTGSGLVQDPVNLGKRQHLLPFTPRTRVFLG